MKKLVLALLACAGLSSCVAAVVPAGVRYDREVYVSPQATYYPSYTYRYYTY
ncbi:MAG TPA: hypothetical protein VL180_01230 [Burkholderiales bacterium]|jgi:hypothetical protein|nr:hypothetical protein [Burkholderiales bacterium]